LGDESGQATTEYILMLAIIVILFLIMLKQLIKPMFASLLKALNKKYENFFAPENLHNFPVRR
jgi:hypothetical protein